MNANLRTLEEERGKKSRRDTSSTYSRVGCFPSWMSYFLTKGKEEEMSQQLFEANRFSPSLYGAMHALCQYICVCSPLTNAMLRMNKKREGRFTSSVQCPMSIQ